MTKTKEELLEVVKNTIDHCNGDTIKAAKMLEYKCETDESMMRGFALHGAAVTEAIIESTNQTKH